MLSLRSALALALLITGSALARGAEPETAALQATISESSDRFLKAYAARDARALALLFTPEAEYVDATGAIFHGRPAIAAEYAARIAVNPPGTLTLEITSIRPIATGLVVEEGVSTFTTPDEGPASQTRYTATHVRQPDGSWLLASVRELQTELMSVHDRLRSLEWLLGAWREEVAGSVVTTDWKWDRTGNFLISEFSTRESQEIALQGTHRIGWNAERQQFRSWIFDSTGGSADGWWRIDADGNWSVQLSGVDAEGGRLSSTITYARKGAENIEVAWTNRIHNGVSLPDLAHRIVRQPPAPGTQTDRKP
jgi:uncharacterized protein (TIGR02246 family)